MVHLDHEQMRGPTNDNEEAMANVMWMTVLGLMTVAMLSLTGCGDSGLNAGGSNSKVCQDGESCDFTCQGGSCDLECKSGSTCNGRCDGGECNFNCADGANCEFGCAGGECNFGCASSTNCELNCAGGQCNFTADNTTSNGSTSNGSTSNGSTSNGSTSNGTTSNGTTSNGSTSNGSTGVQTCADLCTFTESATSNQTLCVSGYMESNGYNVTSSQTCLGINIEEQCNLCAQEFSIEAADCAGAYTRCF